MSKRSRRAKRQNETVEPVQNKRTRKPLVVSARTDTQKQYIKAIRQNNIVFGIGSAGSGKAQPLYSKILTPNGWTTMGDMKVGDLVKGPYGDINKVIGVFPQGVKKIYELELEDGSKTHCCLEHLWEVYSIEYGVEVIETSDIINNSEIDYYIREYNTSLVRTPKFTKCIKSITYVGEEEAQCIMVDSEEHLYITDDYIVTHNTYLAAKLAQDNFINGHVDKIVICRPAVTAGENLGHLPGDINEKMCPYIQPIFDAFKEYWGQHTLDTHLKEGTIEIVPMAFMRGRSFNNAFIIADEIENATLDQVFMLMTRIGEGSTMVLTGDPSQRDILGDTLVRTVDRVEHIEGVEVIEFSSKDVVRSRIVQDIINAWGHTEIVKRDKK